MGAWKVQVQADGREIEVRPGETLFDALRRLDPRLLLRGCRNGGCGVCKLRVAAGEVQTGLSSVAALPPEERAEGMVLACKATPRSDVVVEIPPRPTNPYTPRSH